MISDNNRLIYKHEITVDIRTFINNNIINDMVNIIITKNHQYTNCLTLLKSTCECNLQCEGFVVLWKIGYQFHYEIKHYIQYL